MEKKTRQATPKGSLLPKDLLKTTVLIERGIPNPQKKERMDYKPVGSGFLFDFKKKVLLLTCRHIVREDKENFFIKFNLKDGKTARRSLQSIKERYNVDWVFHQKRNIDIAIIIFGIDFMKDDLLLIPENFIERYENLDEGDDVFFLGYPMGITARRHVYPLVRSGIISAKIEKKQFLIDGNSFPGNSGGPVFLRPSIFNLETRTIGQIRPSKLIGMIFEAIEYSDVAISPQTGRHRITFEENAALAIAYSMDRIMELLRSRKFIKYLKGEGRP